MADSGGCPACSERNGLTCWECGWVKRNDFNDAGVCLAPVPYYLAPGRGIVTQETAGAASVCEAFRPRRAVDAAHG